MTNRFAAIATITVLGAGTVSAQRGKIVTWSVGADLRQAIVHAPSADTSGSRSPLVLSFHGHGDDMHNFQHVDLHRAWPEAVVVYFQGLPSRRDGLSGWQVERGQDDDRDLKLVDAALSSLAKSFTIDSSRIYATGFSNGANFTYLLWAERPREFAAFAAVAARLRPSVKLEVPKPVFHVGGLRDAQIVFADQQAAIDAAKRADGVAGKGASCGSGCTIYTSADSHVMTWIHPGGHEYPPSTSERIVKFFSDHRAKP